MRRKKLIIGWTSMYAGIIIIAFLSLVIKQSKTAIIPPPWSDPEKNPCASQPGGWQLLYWPPLKECFKIFQKGYPCPETMELSPVADHEKYLMKNSSVAECTCPPGTALSYETNKCHNLFENDPCDQGKYFGPIINSGSSLYRRTGNRWGVCKTPRECPAGMIFWPKDGKCYSMYTKGPCARGKLLILNKYNLGECKCDRFGELGEYFYDIEETCHEHYTKGPCSTPGHLFLPGGRCDCKPNFPQFHQEYGMCFELGTPGQCPPGHIFIIPDNMTDEVKQGKCQCKDGYVPWKDGACYRLYTRGPCAVKEFLINATSCVRNFCGKSRLYFPDEKTCYRIGTQGPCSLHQVVVFDFTARPSIDGIAYNGRCGCSGIVKNFDQQCTYAENNQGENSCESSPGMVELNGHCYKLYSRGPCGSGQWLEPIRIFSEKNEFSTSKAKCVCRPGYTSYSIRGGFTGCNPPNVGLARWFLQLFG